MHHYHCSLSMRFCIFQISSEEKAQTEVSRLCHWVIMMSVSTHLPPKEMCLCVKELVGKKKKRNKYGKKICEHGIEDSIWPTEKTETHLTKKTKVQHLSPLCHLQAQANKCMCSQILGPKNCLEKVPDWWSLLPSNLA